MPYHSPFDEEHLTDSPAEDSDDSGTSDVGFDLSRLTLLSPPPQRHGPRLPRLPAERLGGLLGHCSSGQRDEPAVVEALTRVNFCDMLAGVRPPKEGCYPFRLFDCNHFLDYGQLRVQEIDNDTLCADIDVNLQSFATMQAWQTQTRMSWVAVSYDSTIPSDAEARSPPMFEVGGFLIRHDVLQLLCIFVRKWLGLDYLWLDGLCVRQDSLEEKSRWRLPGNVKRVFGCAKATVILLNGLYQLPPSLKPGSTRPVFPPAPDFAGSLRVFLELAFTRNLKSTSLLFTPFEFPSKSMELTAEDLEAARIPLEIFLRAAQGESFQLGGGFNLSFNIPINTFKLSLDNVDRRSNKTNSCRRAETLLSLLSCRDQLSPPAESESGKSTHRTQLQLNPETAAGNWEDAIWHNILFARDADSGSQFIFGLTWLLQDLCGALCQWRIDSEVQRQWQHYYTQQSYPAQCPLPVPQGHYYPTQQPQQVGRELKRPQPDLVTHVIAASREKVDKATGEVSRRVPFVHVMLPILIDKFNDIRGPSPRFVQELLNTGPDYWDIPFLPQWVSLEKLIAHCGRGDISDRWEISTSTQISRAEGASSSSSAGLESNHMGTLYLTVEQQPDQRPLLSLFLKGPFLQVEVDPCIASIAFGTPAAKIWRRTEKSCNTFVQCFKIIPHPNRHCQGRWAVCKYHTLEMRPGEEREWGSPHISCRLTLPHDDRGKMRAIGV